MIVRTHRPRVRRGMGDSVTDWCAADPRAQSFASNLFHLPVTLLACPLVSSNADFGGSTKYPPLPTPGPGTGSPTVQLSTEPAASSQPGAVFAGNDANGVAVYAVPSTAQQNMADFKAAVDEYFRQVGDANPPPAPADCSAWYSVFNPDCGNMNTVLAIGGALLGALVLSQLFGGRR